MNTSIYDFVVERLRSCGLSNRDLAKATGVPLGTIKRLKSRETPNPRISSLQPLHDFFRQHKA